MKRTIALICFCLPLCIHAQYQVGSTVAMGKKTVIKTRPAQGYVIKTDGTKLEGEIQLKVVNNDTTEIQLKSFDGVKTTFARLDLETFGLKGMGKNEKSEGTMMVGDTEVSSAMRGKAKTGDFLPGYVVLNDGSKIQGEVATSSGFQVGDFKKKIWGFYIKAAGSTEPKYYGTTDGVDHVAQTEKGAETRYTPAENYFVDFGELMKSLEDPKAKDKSETLQSGYVVFADGKKMEGRLAKQKSHKFVYVSSDNKIEFLFAKDQNISYLMTRVDGSERKYISLMSNVKAFSGPAQEWVEVFQPSGLYSYYQNPAPTNKKEGMTNLVKGTVNTAVAKGSEEVAEEQAKQQFKSDVKDGKDVISSAYDAKDTKDKTQQNIQSGVGVGEEGGIYFDEWIVINNSTGEKTVVYKKNDEEASGGLLKKCGTSASLDKSEWKKLTNVDNVGLLVTYLNANKCN